MKLRTLFIASSLFTAFAMSAPASALDVNITAGSTYTLQSDISQELKETSGAMVDQLRTAASFTAAQESNVTFTSYLKGTNDLYNVQFFLEDGDLIHRASIAVLSESDDKVLASNVTGLQLKYYDSAGNLLAYEDPSNPDDNDMLSNISLVEIILTMTLSSSQAELTRSVDTMVRIRL